MEVEQAFVTQRTGLLGGAGMLARRDLAWLAGKLDDFSIKAGLCAVSLTNKLPSKTSDACLFLLTTRITPAPHLVTKDSKWKKTGVLDLSRSLTVVCFTQWWKPKLFLWYLSEKWCRGNDTAFSWGNESPEVFRCSWARWGWGLPLPDSEFSWGKGCYLKKFFFFPTKDCLLPHKSAGDFFFFFNPLWTFTVGVQTGHSVPVGGKRETRCHWKFSHLIRN